MFTRTSILLCFASSLLLQHAASCQSQPHPTKFHITKKQLDGFSIGAGAIYGSFLNPVAQRNFEDATVKRKPGFSLEAVYTSFPFIFNLCLFSSNFQLEEINRQAPSDGVTAKHTGAELGVSLALFHFSKTFIPYVGVGYQKAILGTGVFWLGLKDSNQEQLLSVLDVSAPVFKFGADLHFRRLGLRAEYRRGLSTDRGYNQFSLLITGGNSFN